MRLKQDDYVIFCPDRVKMLTDKRINFDSVNLDLWPFSQEDPGQRIPVLDHDVAKEAESSLVIYSAYGCEDLLNVGLLTVYLDKSFSIEYKGRHKSR
ncbi:unnamed protein product [Amoebophrya sp. A25]|nr:unnamed protein product [Amoebophrya sp. A25]|eukprot:GSA25T00026299001.1